MLAHFLQPLYIVEQLVQVFDGAAPVLVLYPVFALRLSALALQTIIESLGY
jgi:hypothetical protein